MRIGQGTLVYILQKAAPIFTAVGCVVRSFASGFFRLPLLEQAWCDAAYWLHQALAESIDTIAIAKLETALEVLVHAENNRGSERRMLEVLRTFLTYVQTILLRLGLRRVRANLPVMSFEIGRASYTERGLPLTHAASIAQAWRASWSQSFDRR